MYYILEWVLASSIPHVDGACIWLPYFDIALYIMFVKLLRLSIFKIKEIFIYLFIYRSAFADTCRSFNLRVSTVDEIINRHAIGFDSWALPMNQSITI